MLRTALSRSSLPRPDPCGRSLDDDDPPSPVSAGAVPSRGEEPAVTIEGEPAGETNADGGNAGEGKTAKDEPDGAGESDDAPGE